MLDSVRSTVPPAAASGDGVRRLMARLATLDLDPPTIEFLTAVLTADLDLREGALLPPQTGCR
jgi:hypothetical protein